MRAFLDRLDAPANDVPAAVVACTILALVWVIPMLMERRENRRRERTRGLVRARTAMADAVRAMHRETEQGTCPRCAQQVFVDVVIAAKRLPAAEADGFRTSVVQAMELLEPLVERPQ